MNLSIGEKIKQLRKQNDVTQEKLAEYLNISYQAISKWENGTALPDITMVIPIANFFGVSADELFDMDTQRQEQEIEEIFKKMNEFNNIGLAIETEALMRDAVKKYPKNYRILSALAYSTDNNEEKIKLCERLLEDCTDHAIRSGAIQQLTFANIDLGNTEKAVEYANMADGIWCCSDILSTYIYKNNPQEKTKITQQVNLTLMDLLCERLVYFITYDNIDDEIIANETAIKMWELLIYDENYLFYNERLYNYNFRIAELYGKKQDKTKVIKHLNLAIKHAFAFENCPQGTYNYTSMFVAAGIHNKNRVWKTSPDTFRVRMLKDLHEECFDFIRNDSDFIAFEQSIKNGL